jgi:hypothetical protein
MRMKRWGAWGALALALVIGQAQAGVAEVRKQVEASRVVMGLVDVDAEGNVRSFSLDDEGALPEVVITQLRASAAQWRFAPYLVEGRATPVKSTMSARMLATPLSDGKYTVRIGGIQFFPIVDEATTVRPEKLTPPDYPPDAARAGGSATVYAVVKVGRDGKVEDAVAEQVNLHEVGTERELRLLRRAFANAVLRAAKAWTFSPPTRGADADKPYWSMRVPVVFRLANFTAEEDGYWQQYVPGPRQLVPWEAGADSVSANADALPAGGAYPVGSGLRLLTPLPGS